MQVLVAWGGRIKVEREFLVYWACGVAALTGAASCWAATHLVRRWSLRIGFVDRPGGHKSHTLPTALGGGIAITLSLYVPFVAGFGVLMLIGGSEEASNWVPDAMRVHLPGLWSQAATGLGIAAGACVLHIMGLWDDRRALGPWVKLCVQVVVAAGIAWGFDVRLLKMLGVIPSGMLTVFWMLVIINAFNFLDNMDGLAAGIAAIAAMIFAVSAIRVGQLFVPTYACLLVGVMLGFLWHNFPPARIFMGDSGSLVVGYTLAVVSVLTTFWDSAQEPRHFELLVPLLALAVPLYDTGSVVLLRLRSGKSPFVGDQRHFSHRLVQRGLKPRRAVLTIYLATLATGLGATVLPDVPRLVALLIVLQCLCVVIIIAILEQKNTHVDSAERS